MRPRIRRITELLLSAIVVALMRLTVGGPHHKFRTAQELEMSDGDGAVRACADAMRPVAVECCMHSHACPLYSRESEFSSL